MDTRKHPEELSLRRLARHIGRALLLRCPHCGRGTLFHGWLRMRETCSRCRLVYDRGSEDNFIGAYLLNLIAAELVIVFAGLGAVVYTWPAVPWDALMWGLAALVVPVPFVTYPYSKALWLAIDLHFQPVTAADFRPDVERA